MSLIIPISSSSYHVVSVLQVGQYGGDDRKY
jgi:hypothetical protein